MIDEYIPSLKKETVTVEKKVYEVLQKNNLDLMDKLDKAKKVLRFYANRRNFDFNNEKELRFCNSDDQADVYQPFGQKAQDCLKEIEE